MRSHSRLRVLSCAASHALPQPPARRRGATKTPPTRPPAHTKTTHHSMGQQRRCGNPNVSGWALN
eukprot:249130-Prymnesium_polylepis.2